MGGAGHTGSNLQYLLRCGAGAALISGLLLLSACQTEPMGGTLNLQVEAPSPVAALQKINSNGAKCWMRSGDRRFRDLHMIPELDTRVGRPRLLIMRSKKQQGLPLLVIEASGSPTTISTYGPLASTRTGAQINADIMRWSGGEASC
ncbi:hypothetical protein A33O_17404 [Nitratireductor aquibiodomus RA22]|uniref:Uncharacterized protein n=2 Tax=Nitratireductor aquibiodomus TaxID=204799 RepID=A0A1H4IL65_9HYPH|nr:hypothetical protein [Nitratireductor aquibiodomus]EIM72950.1 hypothetical protein A33O_17404 [Nitratireductor aquibiodomus RA22]SEB34864.1 hypothetical protein SAMN05216452_0149 [Nitratireductor aquibiodomus]